MSAEMLKRHKAEILANSTSKLLHKERILTDAKRTRAALEEQLMDSSLTGPPTFQPSYP
jgi:hypothetical protein